MSTESSSSFVLSLPSLFFFFGSWGNDLSVVEDLREG